MSEEVNGEMTMAGELWLRFLSGPDIDSLALSNAEIISAVEDAVRAHGDGRVVLEPRVHLVPDNGGAGHFNVLRGSRTTRPSPWARTASSTAETISAFERASESMSGPDRKRSHNSPAMVTSLFTSPGIPVMADYDVPGQDRVCFLRLTA